MRSGSGALSTRGTNLKGDRFVRASELPVCDNELRIYEAPPLPGRDHTEFHG